MHAQNIKFTASMPCVLAHVKIISCGRHCNEKKLAQKSKLERTKMYKCLFHQVGAILIISHQNSISNHKMDICSIFYLVYITFRFISSHFPFRHTILCTVVLCTVTVYFEISSNLLRDIRSVLMTDFRLVNA